jgi:hypothetical protein
MLNNMIRWNSWYDAAARVLKLHAAIDEFGALISDQLPIPNNTYESDDKVLYHKHE